MLNTSRSAQLTLADELRLFGLRQFIRLTRWLNTMDDQVTVVRQYYWLPLLAGLVGVLLGLVTTVAR
jgi:hypothetical protein